jgi:hypothetical protein
MRRDRRCPARLGNGRLGDRQRDDQLIGAPVERAADELLGSRQPPRDGVAVHTACEPEERRARDKELLELYLGELADAGGKAPAFEDAWLRYRQGLFYPYSAWSFTIGRAF